MPRIALAAASLLAVGACAGTRSQGQDPTASAPTPDTATAQTTLTGASGPMPVSSASYSIAADGTPQLGMLLSGPLDPTTKSCASPTKPYFFLSFRFDEVAADGGSVALTGRVGGTFAEGAGPSKALPPGTLTVAAYYSYDCLPNPGVPGAQPGALSGSGGTVTLDAVDLGDPNATLSGKFTGLIAAGTDGPGPFSGSFAHVHRG